VEKYGARTLVMAFEHILSDALLSKLVARAYDLHIRGMLLIYPKCPEGEQIEMPEPTPEQLSRAPTKEAAQVDILRKQGKVHVRLVASGGPRAMARFSRALASWDWTRLNREDEGTGKEILFHWCRPDQALWKGIQFEHMIKSDMKVRWFGSAKDVKDALRSNPMGGALISAMKWSGTE
ncbi:hypothetical protein KIPB_006864, partial [Kipferlia bialata]